MGLVIDYERFFRGVLSFTFLFFSLVVVSPSTEVSASSMDDGYRDYEEVMDILPSSENYMGFIKNSDEPGALEFASEFLSLNEEDQNLFLKAMQPENFI